MNLRSMVKAGFFPLAVLAAGTACDRAPEEKPAPPQFQSLGARAQAHRVFQADRAITKLDVEKASELLQGTTGPAAARAKARLSIYQADCESALSHLATAEAQQQKGAPELLTLARRCHGATAGAEVVKDEKRGVWLRLQDSADRVLAPFVIETAVLAREALEKDLGVDLPRPMRIDLVRDLFSLSAVSGLPVDAAETTGTVAVARWGRITIISPRATYRGYPWADTLAHEVTHLLLSRATADRAPLWLQEGIAKREEVRWRRARPFDREPDPAVVAVQAEREGQSVGITKIGPSIAMLPSARAASIAFSEVTSFMEFWIERLGPHALPLLLREMEVARDADGAMRSVSGLGIEDWEMVWRDHLRRQFADEPMSDVLEDDLEEAGPRQLARTLRLAELLFVEGFADESAELSAPDLGRAPHSAALRFAVTRAAMKAGWDEEKVSPAVAEIEPVTGDLGFYLGDLEDVDDAHAGWLSLYARLLQKGQSSPEARELLEQAVGMDPLLAEVACGGVPYNGAAGAHGDSAPVPEYLTEDMQALCEHVRTLVVRGSM